jgi:amino acid permease
MLCALSLGVGVFLIPSIFAQTGLLPGIGLLFFFGACSTLVTYTIASLPTTTLLPDDATFLLKAFSHATIVITLVTGNAGHLSLVSMMLFDLMEWFVTGDYGNHQFDIYQKATLLCIFLVVIMPYCFMKNLSALKHVGSAVSSVVILTCIAVVCSCMQSLAQRGADGLPGGDYPLPVAPQDVSTLLRLIPTICFCYTSMFTLYPIKRILLADHGPDMGLIKLKKAVLYSGMLQTIIYTTIATVASLTFGTNSGQVIHGTQSSNGNILYNFPPSNLIITFLCLCLVVVIVLDYPLIQFTAVETVISLLPAPKHSSGVYDWCYSFARQIISVVFALVVLTTVLFVPRLDDLFGLCGSLGIAGYCYIVPGIVVWSNRKGNIDGLCGLSVVVLGVGVLSFSSFFIVKHIMETNDDAAV